MRQFLRFLILIIIIISCKEDIYYELRIDIRNLTDKEIQMTLFPKAQYIHGDLYKSTSDGGSYNNMESTILSNSSEIIYSTVKSDYAPSDLLNEVFDSLIIKVNIDSALSIRFKPDFVDNYKINMFLCSKCWSYKMYDGYEKNNFSGNHVIIYDYRFEIVNDSIIKETIMK